jgi:hypothetical protein
MMFALERLPAYSGVLQCVHTAGCGEAVIGNRRLAVCREIVMLLASWLVRVLRVCVTSLGRKAMYVCIAQEG